MEAFSVILIVLGIIFLVIFCASIRIVKQSTAVVIERLGKYHKTLETGVSFIMPFFDRQAIPPIDLRERIADFRPQPVITKDNVTMQIDSVVYYQITDPKLFCYGVSNPIAAIENLTATTLRNIVGELELDETLTSRDVVNAKMREILDEATDPWGIKIHRVELKNILPPQDIREAMEKQMRAERERRESILKAEGEKKSSILIAEGEKESAVLKAEAQKLALIAEAEGERQAAILRAEAEKIKYEQEAEGIANAIAQINKANPSSEYLTLQGFEALKVLANGNSTKIIVPSNLQDVATIGTTVLETVKNNSLVTKKKTK